MPAVAAAATTAIAAACRSIRSSRIASAFAIDRRPPTIPAASQAAAAMAHGPVQRREEKCNGPASMRKPPVMRTTSSTSRALVPIRMRVKVTLVVRLVDGGLKVSGLLEYREETGILLLPFRRQRPLAVHRLVELRSEERGLHAAVDDVPRQHGIAGTVTEHEEASVDTRFGDRGSPVPAVALRRLDCWRDAAVAERQQRLVERMPLRLDVEVNVVDAGHQRPHPLDLPLDDGVGLHRQPLVG